VNLLAVAVAGLAVFEIGVNAAIIYRFWPEPWLTAKIGAVSLLLLYVCLSVVFGSPGWRVWVGAVAVGVDMMAVRGVWRALVMAHQGDGILVAYRRR